MTTKTKRSFWHWEDKSHSSTGFIDRWGARLVGIALAIVGAMATGAGFVFTDNSVPTDPFLLVMGTTMMALGLIAVVAIECVGRYNELRDRIDALEQDPKRSSPLDPMRPPPIETIMKRER